jgi:parallel beta-helix repeat protein
LKDKPKQLLHSQNPRKRRTIFNAKKIILITILLFTPFLVLIRPASSTTINVPSQYPSIQDAVIAATAGDIIQVAAGTYYEHVSINKTLTIQGENPQTTIVDGNGTDSPFYIDDATNVLIKGFTIQNAGNNSSGIVANREIVQSDNNRIENNIIKTSLYGITVSGSNNNKIYNNTIVDNPLGGVFLFNADNTNVTGNTIKESVYGIRIVNSAINNQIINNEITQTAYGIHITMTSTGTIIRGNTISGQTNGIYSTCDSNIIDHNTIANGSIGIYLYNCRISQITYNTIVMPYGTGIRFYHTSPTTASHQVTNNKIINSAWAIDMTNSNGNTLWGNWIQDNTYAFSLASSGSNNIYRNNFIRNIQEYVNLANNWDISGNGNHWSDHTTPDANGDGIVDTEYNLTITGTDHYPLKYTWSEHDIAVQSVVPSTNQVNPGATVTITVAVQNIANISTTATFTVTAKYNNTIIGTQQVTNLARGAPSILTFNWDTTGVEPGKYTIKAQASTITDELNTDNNNLSGGTVKINAPLTGDINGDGTINQQDLNLLMQEYGLTPNSPTWNPNADLNKDNIVDEQDLYILGQNYSKTD